MFIDYIKVNKRGCVLQHCYASACSTITMVRILGSGYRISKLAPWNFKTWLKSKVNYDRKKTQIQKKNLTEHCGPNYDILWTYE